MSCARAAKLDLYLDSELPGAEAAEIESHLRGCPSCAAAAVARLQLKGATRIAGRRFSPSPELRFKIERAVTVAPRPRWVWRYAASMAAVAALALMVILPAVWLERGRRDQALSELADLHVSTLASANPIDVASSDRHTVKPWFQGKLPFTFNLPELEDSGFALIGGRLAYFQQGPGAQLLSQLRDRLAHHPAADKGSHRLQAAVQPERAQHGLHGIREYGAFSPQAAVFLATAETQVAAQADGLAYLRHVQAADQLGADTGQVALVPLRVKQKQSLGHHQTQHGVSQKLQALIVARAFGFRLNAIHNRLACRPLVR